VITKALIIQMINEGYSPEMIALVYNMPLEIIHKILKENES